MGTKTTQLLAILLTLIFIVGVFPMAALAVAQGDPGSVTETYINESDGREIAPPQTAKSTEAKNPQAIIGYVYESFSEVTEHVYAKECLQYIQGYPDRPDQQDQGDDGQDRAVEAAPLGEDLVKEHLGSHIGG